MDVRALLADFVWSLAFVYSALIIVYALQTMIPLGYSRPVMALRRLLDDTVAPYLLLFRRVIPPVGPLDLSAMVGLVAVWLASGLVQGLLR